MNTPTCGQHLTETHRWEALAQKTHDEALTEEAKP